MANEVKELAKATGGMSYYPKDLAEIDRITFLLQVLDKRRELDKIRDQWTDSADLRARVVALFSCTADQAAMIIAIPWPKLAKMEATTLKARWAECRREVGLNQKIMKDPDPRMELDVQSTLLALEKTRREAAALREVNRAEGR